MTEKPGDVHAVESSLFNRVARGDAVPNVGERGPMIPGEGMIDDVIVLFSKPDCPECVTARAFLAGRGVEFFECDVSTDEYCLRLMLTLTGEPRVPTISAAGEVAIGFDPIRIEEILELYLNRPPEPPDLLDEEDEEEERTK